MGTKPAGEATPASSFLTGHGKPRRSVCAPTAAASIVSQTALERKWIMKARSTRLAVEALEDRSVPATVAYGDFNNDGLMDRAAITGQKTITVSLANLDGSYAVSATLTAPKPIEAIAVTDFFADGNLDIQASGSKPSDNFAWSGHGDGTFSYIEPWRPRPHSWF